MMNTFRSPIIAAFLLVVTLPAIAGELEDAYAAERRGDYATAVKMFNSLATQNEPSAQLALGLMHTRGKGVPQDLDEALKWFRLATENPTASQTTRDDAIYNRDFILRKQREWAEADTARQHAADAAAARQLQQLRAAEAADQSRRELEDLRVENERRRAQILKQAQRDQKESARRQEELDAELARLRADRDQAAANRWDAREKAQRRANGGTGF